jgi:hypothetical protein
MRVKMQGLGIFSIIVWLCAMLMNIGAFSITKYLLRASSNFTEGNPIMRFCFKNKLDVLFLLIYYSIYSVILFVLLKIKLELIAVVFVVIIAIIWGYDFIADLRHLYLFLY